MGTRTHNFFHSKASQCRRRNHIQGIKNSDGTWVEKVEDTVEVASNYFDSLLNAGTYSQIDDFLNTVSHKMTLDMQQILSNDFTAEEIKAMLFQMGPTKALGLDGMNILFYQKIWHVVGDSVVTAILDYLNFSG